MRSKTRSSVPLTSSHGGVAVEVIVENNLPWWFVYGDLLLRMKDHRVSGEVIIGDNRFGDKDSARTVLSYLKEQWRDDHVCCVVGLSPVWCNVHDTVGDAINSIGLSHKMGLSKGGLLDHENVTVVERFSKLHPSDIISGTAYAPIAKVKLRDGRGQIVHVNLVYSGRSTVPIVLKRDTKLWEAQKLIAEEHLPVKRGYSRKEYMARKLEQENMIRIRKPELENMFRKLGALKLEESEPELLQRIFDSANRIDVKQLWLRV